MNVRIGRSVTLILAAVVGALLLASGAALAATITCQAGVDCIGTKNADSLLGTDSNDYMHANGSSTINWDDDAIRNVEGSSGDDDMVGNSLGNIFDGGYGEDTISSGGGDDFIYVDGDSYNDHVDCGSNLLVHDHDTVYANSTDVVASNCEEVHTLPES